MKATNKTRQQLAEMFINSLKEDKLPWRACWQTGRPHNAVTKAHYRGVNRLLLTHIATERGYTDPRWCTYLQAQKQGWQVLRGEKGVPVEYWAYVDPEQKKWLTWNEVATIRANDPDRYDKLELRYRISTVFNGQQIEGIPELTQQETIMDAAQITQIRDTILRNMVLAYREEGSRAYYSPFDDRVTLPPIQSFDNDYAYLCTFLHEAGHATSHESRLNRGIGIRGTVEYAREELRAEIASAFTAQEIGLPMESAEMNEQLDLHKAYIQSWIQVLEKDPNELFAAIKEADRICDYLLEMGEFHEQGAEKQPHQQQRIPVGRIDYYSSKGMVVEQFEYYDAESFITNIKQKNYYGVPMGIVLYKDFAGKTIPKDFVYDLDPPPLSFKTIDYHVSQQTSEIPSYEP